MTAISIAVVWLAVGLIVAIAFGTAVRKSRQEPDEDAVPERRGGELRYLRNRARHVKEVNPRKNVAKRQTAA